jgi:hypothetical protein
MKSDRLLSMGLCLLLIPLFAILNTLLALKIMEKIWARRIVEALLQQKFEEGAFLQEFMEQRYEEFIALLKKRIPMAEMFFTGSLEESVRSQVKQEIPKLLPKFKQLMSESHGHELKIPRKYLWKGILSLIAISFILGVGQLLLFWLLC